MNENLLDEHFLAETVERLRKTRTLHKRATVIYRCTNRNHHLLYVFRIHGQYVVYQPPYKFSDEINERESVPAARSRLTVDGDRRYQRSTFLLAQAAGHLSVQCDDCQAKIRVDSIAADAAAATRQPTEIRLANNSVR